MRTSSYYNHVTLKKVITPCRQELQSPNWNKGKFIVIKIDRFKCKSWGFYKVRTIILILSGGPKIETPRPQPKLTGSSKIKLCDQNITIMTGNN